MANPDFAENKRMILENEEEVAKQLALLVIEKPTPRVWMIFIPIFFVFYFWKLKHYQNALKDFAGHYLVPRGRVLDALLDAREAGRPLAIDQVVEQFGGLQEKQRALCAEWLAVLVEHYALLLDAKGDSYSQLVRAGYRNKSNYMLFYRRLIETEGHFNTALLPTIEGDNITLSQVTEAISGGVRMLKRKEAERIFS